MLFAVSVNFLSTYSQLIVQFQNIFVVLGDLNLRMEKFLPKLLGFFRKMIHTILKSG